MPTLAVVRMALAVRPKVTLPAAASNTCIAAPATTSPFWIIPSFAPNGPPGDEAASTIAMNTAAGRPNSVAMPQPSSGTTTRLARSARTSSNGVVTIARNAGSVVPRPAANMVAAMKITVSS